MATNDTISTGWRALRTAGRAAAFAGLAFAWSPAAPAAVNTAAGPEVPVRVRIEQGLRDIVLVRRVEGDIFYRLTNSPPGVTAVIKPEQVTESDFVFTLDWPKVYQSMRRQQWAVAAQMILTAIGPTLPYLDIPENNATDPALLAGRCLVRAAEQYARAGGGLTNATAQQLYVRANEVLRQVGRAAWFPYAENAYLRGTICLIDIGKLDEAAKSLEEAREPEVGDGSYGIYWLAQARLKYAREQIAPALDAAVKSMVYENKDVESFPDALMQTAQCYEDLNELYRARDVYFEVARLFRGTSWGDSARKRLQYIMDKGLTAKPEQANIAGVFFGTEEDMNALSTAFLKSGGAAPDDEPPPEPAKPAEKKESPEAQPEGEKTP